MTSFIIVAAVVYVVLVAALYVFQRNILYFPDTSVPSPVHSGVPEMQPVTLETEDGLKLLAWYRAAEGKPVLVYFHGNAGNIGARGFKVRPYLDAGFGVLLVSYRGYGGNPGSPTDEGLYADARAALDFLKARGVAPERTVLYGESLGTGVAVQMASELGPENPVAALVLEAPFTSMGDVAAHHYPYVPARWLIKDRFDSAAKIGGVKAPVLVIHGDRDRTIPVKFGKLLFEAAVEPKEGRWLEGGDHNDLYDFGAARIVVEFLRARLGVAGPQGGG
ncbi:MAG: alpha/beta hydrolase [Rhodospirillales bacterium]